jgi:hypothetical protein
MNDKLILLILSLQNPSFDISRFFTGNKNSKFVDVASLFLISLATAPHGTKKSVSAFNLITKQTRFKPADPIAVRIKTIGDE